MGRMIPRSRWRIVAALLAGLLMLAAAHPLRAARARSYDTRPVAELIAGYELLENGQKAEAAERFRRAMELDRGSAFLKTLYAEVLFELGRIEPMVRLLEPLARRPETTDPQALKLLAFGYQALNRPDQAVRFFKLALERDPEDDWLRRRLLELLRTQGRYQELIPLYKPLIHPESETYAFDLYQLGAIYLTLGAPEPARQYLEQSLAADSGQAETHRLLGSLNEREGRWDEALERYLAYAELAPEDSGEVYDRIFGAAVRVLNGRELAEAPDSANWNAFLAKLEARRTGSGQLSSPMLRVMALGYELTGAPERALEIYSAALEQDPADRVSRRNLLRLLFQADRYEEMIPLYQPLLDPKDPGYARDLVQLGVLHIKLRQFDQAREHLQRAIQADPQQPEPYQLLGHLSEIDRQWRQAQHYYLVFLQLAPAALRGEFQRLVNVSLQLKELDKPISLLRQATAEGDTSLWTAEQLGRLYYQNEEYEQALGQLEPLRERLTADGHYVLGFLLARQERYEEAAASFLLVREQQPDFLPVYLTLSRVYGAAGKLERAAQVLEQGLERAPIAQQGEERRELLFGLANICHERQDYPAAERWLLQVLKEYPDHAPALNYLGYFYAERGTRLEEAMRLIRRALEQEPENATSPG